MTRGVIRDCAKAVKSIHTNELKLADADIKSADHGIAKLAKVGVGFEHNTNDAFQEYVEVKALRSIIARKGIPSDRDLRVPEVTYLLGLADLVGELRRELHNCLRANDRRNAEYFFNAMNEVYDNLMTIKYATSLVGPLRRKQDVARIQLEQARSEMLHLSHRS